MIRREISKMVWFILKEKKLGTTRSQAFFSIGKKFIHYF
ncbi:hypothetical protein FM130_02655 [Enterococcus faecium]|nr:hypothetical protein FM130_02655 [Enterococcus faecium]